MTQFEPYRPDVDGPWTRREAGHLLRRSGFCGSEVEIRQVLSDGPAKTVERLISQDADSPRHDELDRTGEEMAARGDIQKLAAWWLMRMLHTQRPLQSRMAVFWHNHFATGNQKVNSPPMMLRQLRTIGRHALGRFDELVLAMSRDPAMIVWLDGDSNRKGKANENYARELFELFTLGPGNYSEADIREAARAFSGWHQRSGTFFFNERLHDEGGKSVFGESGNWGGADVVALAVKKDACAAFIARKLLREFVTAEPDEGLVNEFAAIIRDAKLNMAGAMGRLLVSRAFFAPANYRARIKSPVELGVGLARSFEMRIPGQARYEAVSQMGQRLFEPPSVKGWDGHRRWINSSTMLVRMNAVTNAAAGANGAGLDAGKWVTKFGLSDAAAAIEFAGNLMLDGDVSEETKAALTDTCTGSAEAALRTAVAAIGASPEYQLA